MKKLINITSIPIFIVLLFLISSCKNELSPSLNELNTYLEKEYHPEIKNRDSIYLSISKKLRQEFNQFETSELTHEPFGRIDESLANCFHKLYKMSPHDSRDVNLASCIPLDTFLFAVRDQYRGVIDFNDQTTWARKAFIIYFGNYGDIGHTGGTGNTGKHQTTAILQFAKVVTSDSLAAIQNSTYDFGDLKPPKKVLNGLTGISADANCIQN